MQLKVLKGMDRATRLEVLIDERDERLALVKALFFCEPDICGKCQNADGIRWRAHKAKGKGGTFTFVTRVCLKCRHQSEMGEYQDGGFFWKQWQPKPARATDVSES